MMLPDIKVGDKVEVHSTSDPMLDGQSATVAGVYTPEYLIILFENKLPAPYYDPARVMSIYCLKKV
jgi:hypothetical protein